VNWLQFRPAVPADYQAIADLLNSAYRAVGARPNETAQTVRERAEDVLVLVVDLLGLQVGTLTTAPSGSFYGRLAKKGQMQVSRLAVHPDFQGRGIAKKMVRTLMELSRKQGVEALVGASLDTMATAHQLYESIGAQPVEIPGTKARGYTLQLNTTTPSTKAGH
jgi:ribosomal protein S18 acetylase RimI-like enzyme